jgi:hypothetical protein
MKNKDIYGKQDSERVATLDSILSNYEKRHSTYLRLYFRLMACLLLASSVLLIVNLFIPLLVAITTSVCLITVLFLIVFIKDELLLIDIKRRINSLYTSSDEE